MENCVLEINLISAQGLKVPSANLRRMQTYAIAWVDSSAKLRTRVDRVGGENPSWNDKFLFRVSPEFLASDTSAVSVEIYAVGVVCDKLVGTVRFLISNVLPGRAAISSTAMKTPAFTALQIRRQSGRFHGVINICACVIDGSEFPALTELSAMGYRDLMGGSLRFRRWRDRRSRKLATAESSGESCCGDSADLSDGADSTTSSSSTASTALKDWNGVRELTATKGLKVVKSVGGGMLCGLMIQRKNEWSPSDQNGGHRSTTTEKEGGLAHSK